MRGRRRHVTRDRSFVDKLVGAAYNAGEAVLKVPAFCFRNILERKRKRTALQGDAASPVNLLKGRDLLLPCGDGHLPGIRTRVQGQRRWALGGLASGELPIVSASDGRDVSGVRRLSECVRTII